MSKFLFFLQGLKLNIKWGLHFGPATTSWSFCFIGPVHLVKERCCQASSHRVVQSSRSGRSSQQSMAQILSEQWTGQICMLPDSIRTVRTEMNNWIDHSTPAQQGATQQHPQIRRSSMGPSLRLFHKHLNCEVFHGLGWADIINYLIYLTMTHHKFIINWANSIQRFSIGVLR